MSYQIKDTLIHRQSNQKIVSISPLINVLKNRQLLQVFEDGIVELNWSNRRGFTCEWTIVDGELYLSKFRSSSMKIHKTAQIFGTEPISELIEAGDQNIHSFYPNDTTQIKADWFSGIIVAYDRFADNEEDLNGWEYAFQEGKLIDEKRRYVWDYGSKTAKKLQKYIED